MTRLKRIEAVNGYLGERADRAARAMVRARQRVEQEAQRLEQLRQFRQEYKAQFAGADREVINAFRLRDFNAFIARLDAAVSRQERHLEEVRKEATRAESHWQAERSRADALEKVADNYRQERARRDADAEQQLSDEIAMQRYRFRG